MYKLFMSDRVIDVLVLNNNHSEFRVVMSATISAYIRCSIRLYLQLFEGGLLSYLWAVLTSITIPVVLMFYPLMEQYLLVLPFLSYICSVH